MKQANKPRTCATHNPGSPDCGPNCPDALRDPNATPGLVFAMADGTKVGAPADVARAQMGSAYLANAPGNYGPPIPPEVGPESVEDMDDAVDDIEQRDDDSDEVDTDIEGDDEETDDDADIARENANLRLQLAQSQRMVDELGRQLHAERAKHRGGRQLHAERAKHRGGR